MVTGSAIAVTCSELFREDFIHISFFLNDYRNNTNS